MQVIIKHWTDENLKSPAKTVNAPLIKKYTGVELENKIKQKLYQKGYSLDEINEQIKRLGN